METGILYAGTTMQIQWVKSKKIEEYIRKQLTEDFEYYQILFSEYIDLFIDESVIKGKYTGFQSQPVNVV